MHDSLLIFYGVLYLILTLYANLSIGPGVREELNDFKTRTQGRKLTSQEFVKYYYLLSDSFIVTPFTNLARENKHYNVRLFAFFLDFIYGGVGYVVWFVLFLIYGLVLSFVKIVDHLKTL